MLTPAGVRGSDAAFATLLLGLATITAATAVVLFLVLRGSMAVSDPDGATPGTADEATDDGQRLTRGA